LCLALETIQALREERDRMSKEIASLRQQLAKQSSQGASTATHTLSNSHTGEALSGGHGPIKMEIAPVTPPTTSSTPTTSMAPASSPTTAASALVSMAALTSQNENTTPMVQPPSPPSAGR
jgi:hypothetical protein